MARRFRTELASFTSKAFYDAAKWAFKEFGMGTMITGGGLALLAYFRAATWWEASLLAVALFVLGIIGIILFGLLFPEEPDKKLIVTSIDSYISPQDELKGTGIRNICRLRVTNTGPKTVKDVSVWLMNLRGAPETGWAMSFPVELPPFPEHSRRIIPGDHMDVILLNEPQIIDMGDQYRFVKTAIANHGLAILKVGKEYGLEIEIRADDMDKSSRNYRFGFSTDSYPQIIFS
jgi:hypothetical protein